MIKGVVRCKCGKTYGFETAHETVACLSCGARVKAKDYGTGEPKADAVEWDKKDANGKVTNLKAW